ncbi:hypothetical protein, partial [Pseudomonas sp. SIMBA_044]
LVKVLQQEKKISLTQAYMEALELHNIYLEEFLLLQKNLPTFDNHQELIYDYVQDLGIMIAGVYAWHTNDTFRYLNNG